MQVRGTFGEFDHDVFADFPHSRPKLFALLVLPSVNLPHPFTHNNGPAKQMPHQGRYRLQVVSHDFSILIFCVTKKETGHSCGCLEPFLSSGGPAAPWHRFAKFPSQLPLHKSSEKNSKVQPLFGVFEVSLAAEDSAA